MDSSRKELQPSTPSALKVSKDSFKAKKMTLSDHHRSPVVVHTHTPKVIHARPQDFMRVVQLLTGKSSSPTAVYPPASVYSVASSSSYYAPNINEIYEINGDPRSNPCNLAKEFSFY